MAVDIAEVTRVVNALAPRGLSEPGMTWSQAWQLLKYGEDAIEAAIEEAGGLWGENTRGKVAERLAVVRRRMMDVPPVLSGPLSGPPRDIASELRAAAIAAFVELNAAAEGNATLDAARASIFADAVREFGHLAGQVAATAGQAVGTLAGGTLQGIIGSPGGLLVLAVVVWLAVKR